MARMAMAIDFPKTKVFCPELIEELKIRLNRIGAYVRVADVALEALWYEYCERYEKELKPVTDKTFNNFCEWVKYISAKDADQIWTKQIKGGSDNG